MLKRSEEQSPRRMGRRALFVAGMIVVAAVAAVGFAGDADAATPTVYYHLPWLAGDAATVNQGQNGDVSHQGSLYYAYDFGLGGSQEIRASAPGTIVQKDTSVTGQTGPGSWGNFVVLKHSDGTCTRYAHMKYGSVLSLGVGSQVYQGQKLGIQGNTGYTLPVGRGYHLHFQRENCSSRASMDVDFVEIANPVEDASYTSANPAGLKCANAYATQVGTSAAQTMYGTEGVDVIVGRGGNDRILGLGGDDVLCGGDGNDSILGGSGRDRLFGEGGSDTILGEAGVDHILGGVGNDVLHGGSENDYLNGESGNDSIDGSYGTDLCDGSTGYDYAYNCETRLSFP